jgi:hypothetical protein
MNTFELIWTLYGFIAFATFIWETMDGKSAWHGMASGILWPVYPLKAAVKLIIGLFR